MESNKKFIRPTVVYRDNSIDNESDLVINPDPRCTLTNNSEISFTISSSDSYIDVSESYLYFNIRVVKTDGTNFLPDLQGGYPNIVLINNGIMFLFKLARYTIDDVEIENIDSPGYATLLKGLLTKKVNFNGLNQCWAIDTGDGKNCSRYIILSCWFIYR